MIRMGRGSRPEPANDTAFTSQPVDNTGLNEQYTSQTATAGKVVTDSEAMARDIKEGRLSGFVGHGTTLTGETNFQAMLRVDGHLIGTITSDSGTLIIGTNGQVDANISVSSAVVNGTVNGDIVATERIQLGRTARVIGNVQAPRLLMEEGAVLEGGCNMLKALELRAKLESESEAKYQPAASSSEESTSTYGLIDDDEIPAPDIDLDEDEDSESAAA